MISTAVFIGGVLSRISVPDDYLSRGPLGIVIYHHGSGEGAGSGETPGDLRWDTIVAVTDSGRIWASCTAHSDNCGNALGIADYDALLDYLTANYETKGWANLYAQSFGGISGFVQAANNPLIRGVVGIYPACNSRWMYDNGFSGAYDTAFPGINSGNFASMTAGRDPVLLDGSLFTGKRAIFFASPDDTAVNKVANTDAMQALVAPYALESSVIVTTGVHGDPSNFQVTPTLDFLDRADGIGSGSISATTANFGTLNIG